MIVYGFDLALTATGRAVINDDGHRSHTIPTTADQPIHKRLHKIVRDCDPYDADLIVIEGLVHRSQSAGSLGMVHGAFWQYHRHLADRIVVLPPAVVKKYATGKGNSGKSEMLVAAVHRLGYQGHDHNQADALWLAAAGAHLLGRPVVDLPAVHQKALQPYQRDTAA